MAANIDAVRSDADSVGRAETDVSGKLYELSFAGEYGHGAVTEAAGSIRSANRHAALAVAAVAVANPILVAKHEAQAAAADAEAGHMLRRAESYRTELVSGLQEVAAAVEAVAARAEALVAADDSSPAAGLRARIADQAEAVQEWLRRLEEIGSRVPGSRDQGELHVAGEHFLALRAELEEASAVAAGIASDAEVYSGAI